MRLEKNARLVERQGRKLWMIEEDTRDIYLNRAAFQLMQLLLEQLLI